MFLYYLLITILTKLSDMQEEKLETECKIDVVPHGEDDIKDKAEVRYNTLYDWPAYMLLLGRTSSIELYAMLTYVASIICGKRPNTCNCSQPKFKQ